MAKSNSAPQNVSINSSLTKNNVKHNSKPTGFRLIRTILNLALTVPLYLGLIVLLNSLFNNDVIAVVMVVILATAFKVLDLYIQIDEKIIDPNDTKSNDPQAVLKQTVTKFIINLVIVFPFLIMAITLFYSITE